MLLQGLFAAEPLVLLWAAARLVYWASSHAFWL